MKKCFQHFKYEECVCHSADPDVIQVNSKDIVGCSFPVTGFDWFLRDLFPYIFIKIYAAMELNSEASLTPKRTRPLSETSISVSFGSFGKAPLPPVPSETTHGDVLRKVCQLTRPKSKITVNDFVFQEVLGEGSFGMVVLCTSSKSGKQYAMKLQENDEIMRSREDDIFDVTAESTMLQNLNHPFICKLHAAFRTEV